MFVRYVNHHRCAGCVRKWRSERDEGVWTAEAGLRFGCTFRPSRAWLHSPRSQSGNRFPQSITPPVLPATSNRTTVALRPPANGKLPDKAITKARRGFEKPCPSARYSSTSSRPVSNASPGKTLTTRPASDAPWRQTLTTPAAPDASRGKSMTTRRASIPSPGQTWTSRPLTTAPHGKAMPSRPDASPSQGKA